MDHLKQTLIKRSVIVSSAFTILILILRLVTKDPVNWKLFLVLLLALNFSEFFRFLIEVRRLKKNSK